MCSSNWSITLLGALTLFRPLPSGCVEKDRHLTPHLKHLLNLFNFRDFAKCFLCDIWTLSLFVFNRCFLFLCICWIFHLILAFMVFSVGRGNVYPCHTIFYRLS